jgi:hypothetical protein
MIVIDDFLSERQSDEIEDVVEQYLSSSFFNEDSEKTTSPYADTGNSAESSAFSANQK